MRAPLIALFCLALPLPALAGTCSMDIDAVNARIDQLEPSYRMVRSDIGCDSNTLPARQMMCASVEGGDQVLWRMGRLDDLAWVHAVENAIGQEVDPENPPRDAAFIATRDACLDEACLCEALISHTNDSLGGTSPYPQ